MAEKNSKIEEISLDIANHWSVTDFLNERNDNSGVLVGFDWKIIKNEYYLSEINTNIDLGKLESEKFEYNTFLKFLKEHKYTFVLGLDNVNFSPSDEWLDKLKKSLKSKSVIDYDKYTVQAWPSPIPKLETPNNVFILRYCFDTNNKVDELAASNELFSMFMKENQWKPYHEQSIDEIKEKKRVILMCSKVKNIILHRGYER